jgi:ribosomal protein S18 acetylase RimI-like enzyme
MSIEVRLLGTDDAGMLSRVADDVFDNAVDPEWSRAFFADRHSHMAVALDDGLVVGMVSAIDYVHPDRAPQLWINEVGVASSHRRQGLARRLLDLMLAHGRALGCTEAWLGTDGANVAARTLYDRAGGVAAPFVLYSFPLGDTAPPDASVSGRGAGTR